MSKIIFITGASSGFGKAIAEKFAYNGWDIIITGRREERLISIKKELEPKYKISVLPLCFDVQNKEAVFAAVKKIPENWQKIDILINNAGLALGRDYFDDASLDDWDTMIDTNVKGLLYVSKALLPILKKSKFPHIINIGSTAGKEVYEKGNVYCATKHAVDAISKAMRIDLLKHKIKVTSVNPGAAETEFSLVRFKGNEDEAKKVYEGFKPLYADDIADIVWYAAALPPHVCINDIVVTCTSQANSFYVYK